MVYNTALNSSDNLSYPPDNHHSSDDVYRSGGGCVLLYLSGTAGARFLYVGCPSCHLGIIINPPLYSSVPVPVRMPPVNRSMVSMTADKEQVMCEITLQRDPIVYIPQSSLKLLIMMSEISKNL